MSVLLWSQAKKHAAVPNYLPRNAFVFGHENVLPVLRKTALNESTPAVNEQRRATTKMIEAQELHNVWKKVVVGSTVLVSC